MVIIPRADVGKAWIGRYKRPGQNWTWVMNNQSPYTHSEWKKSNTRTGAGYVALNSEGDGTWEVEGDSTKDLPYICQSYYGKSANLYMSMRRDELWPHSISFHIE